MNSIIAAIIGAVSGIFCTILIIFQEQIRSKIKNIRFIEYKISREVDKNSKYRIQRIPSIVKEYLQKNSINVDNLNFAEEFTIYDLYRFCRIYYPNIPSEKIKQIIFLARSDAFTIKYADPKEDEKIKDIHDIKYDGLKEWTYYFFDFISLFGIQNLTDLSLLDVGIGNGNSVTNIFIHVKNLNGTDISYKALEYAKNNLPNLKYLDNCAEELIDIKTGSIDLYVSLRTYQSTLFDVRAAMTEAYRVLRQEGVIIISIPIMFLKDDGTILTGLIRPGDVEPNMEYAFEVAKRISNLLEILNFKNINTYYNSPFEIFIGAKR